MLSRFRKTMEKKEIYREEQKITDTNSDIFNYYVLQNV